MFAMIERHINHRLLHPCERSSIRNRVRICRIDGPYLDGIRPRVVGCAEWRRGKKGIQYPVHNHPLPPVKGALGAWETLQRTLEVAAKEPDAVKVRASDLRREIDPNKTSNLIVGDGCVHSLR